MTRAIERTEAAEQLADIRSLIVILARIAARVENPTHLEPAKTPELIDDLPVGQRVKDPIRDVGLVQVADLIKCTGDHLLTLAGFGRYSLRELRRALARHGLSLADDPQVQVQVQAGKRTRDLVPPPQVDPADVSDAHLVRALLGDLPECRCKPAKWKGASGHLIRHQLGCPRRQAKPTARVSA